MAVHAAALVLGLLVLTPEPASSGHGAPRSMVLAHIAAVEPVVADDEVVEDGLELFDEPCLEDDDVLLPAVVADDSVLVEDDLPDEYEPECVERAPLTLPEVPLDAVRIRARRPRAETSEAAPASAARAAPKAAPKQTSPKRASPKRPRLKLVHRPDVRRYYPEAARRRGIEGTALVRIEVDRSGLVTEARIARSSGSALLDRHALRFARDMRFLAGRAGRALQPVSFLLQ